MRGHEQRRHFTSVLCAAAHTASLTLIHVRSIDNLRRKHTHHSGNLYISHQLPCTAAYSNQTLAAGPSDIPRQACLCRTRGEQAAFTIHCKLSCVTKPPVAPVHPHVGFTPSCPLRPTSLCCLAAPWSSELLGYSRQILRQNRGMQVAQQGSVAAVHLLTFRHRVKCCTTVTCREQCAGCRPPGAAVRTVCLGGMWRSLLAALAVTAAATTPLWLEPLQ